MRTIYKNLKIEIKLKGLTGKQIALEIGIAQETFSRKLSGSQHFWLEEAKAIHQKFFPNTDFLYLFSRVRD